MKTIWDDGRFASDNITPSFITDMKNTFGDSVKVINNKLLLLSTKDRKNFLEFCESWLKSEIEFCFNGYSLSSTEIIIEEELEDFDEMCKRVDEFYKSMCIERKGILKEFCLGTGEYL
jgi:hypothetical protein